MNALQMLKGGADEEAQVSQQRAALRLLGPSDPERAQQPERQPVASLAPGICYQRGALVSATDGPVGTLRQVMVDEDKGEVKALVVRMADKHESVLMPPDLVDKSVGSGLLLNVTKAQFTAGASRSPRFDARMFTAADTGRVANLVSLLPRSDPRRSVVAVNGDYVETGNAVPASSNGSASAPAHWWNRLGLGESGWFGSGIGTTPQA
jgi:hypothetical protein